MSLNFLLYYCLEAVRFGFDLHFFVDYLEAFLVLERRVLLFVNQFLFDFEIIKVVFDPFRGGNVCESVLFRIGLHHGVPASGTQVF